MKKTTWVLAMVASMSFGVQASEWGYEGEHAPEHWGKVAPLCAEGKNQSPIDVAQSVEADLQPFTLNYQGQVVGLLNNGHTLQAIVRGNNPLQIDGKTFQLKQFHFHTPSENLLKGKQFPLEAHFVHADEQGNLAVVAVMYQVGRKIRCLRFSRRICRPKGIRLSSRKGSLWLIGSQNRSTTIVSMVH